MEVYQSWYMYVKVNQVISEQASRSIQIVYRACRPYSLLNSTHALIMDAGVLGCVLECMCEDFKHFEAHAAASRNSHENRRDSGKGSHSQSISAGAGQVSKKQRA